MKSWRVGSFSMGAALIFLGVFLLLTQVFHWNTATILVAWWPLLLIILGIEVLLSLYFSKQDKPIVKYDIISILFIGIIGMCGIALTIFTTTGVLTKVTHAMAAETKTLNLPKYNKEIGDNVKRIVLETQNQPIIIETTSENSVATFGTYKAAVVKNHIIFKAVEDYLMVEQKGDTIYLKLKDGPDQHEPFLSEIQLAETILVPSNVRLEVQGEYNSIIVKPRALSNNWYINGASNVDIQVMDKPDLTINAIHADELIGDPWKTTKQTKNDENSVAKNGTMKIGAGSHHIIVTKTSSVSVTHLP
jgi:hypothetical protein